MYNHDGSIDEVWKYLFELVHLLGRDGASSDESETENGSLGAKVKVCRVKV